ncbi:SpoIIAA family protein [Stigmatella hybrida]|uniref:STAS/SEC14 domain-containing protein n=1 Tax=Stigmatella hybrida TaxID=394097 RepID=UPI001CDAC830|nr:STAS/SEC14 domain-containing protein [Stigmatella hybrida]
METQAHFGPHTLSFEEPDIVRLTPHGQFDLREAREMILRVREFQKGREALYLLVDARQGTGFSAEVRRAISEDRSLVPYAGVALFGASFTLRTIANMMERANVLLGRPSTYQSVFTKTEEEARAWIDAQRAARAQAR